MMTMCTIFTLFSNDIQVAFLPKSVDVVIENIQAAFLFLFLFEIFMTVFAKKDYSGSFFFWLDIVATISMVQDIDWMFLPLMNIGQE
jgi:hypothetical protein